MKDKLGNPIVAAVAQKVIDSPEAMNVASDLVKQAGSTSKLVVKIMGAVIFTPIIIAGGYFVFKQFKANKQKSENEDLEEQIGDKNQQIAIDLRRYITSRSIGICDADKNKILSAVKRIKTNNDWEDVVLFYKNKYKNTRPTCLKNKTKNDAILINDIEETLDDKKWQIFIAYINKLKTANVEEFYIKAKRKTNVYKIISGVIFPNNSSELRNNYTIKDYKYEGRLKSDNNYVVLKKGFMSMIELAIAYKDIQLITRSDYDKLIANGKFIELS